TSQRASETSTSSMATRLPPHRWPGQSDGLKVDSRASSIDPLSYDLLVVGDPLRWTSLAIDTVR
ncbi:MAG: hypothetical protein WAV54_09115, partial [Acidimicrobiales bacterium]